MRRRRHFEARSGTWLLGLAGLALAAAVEAGAQVPPPLQTPLQEFEELPQAELPPPSDILPPAPIPLERPGRGLSASLHVFAREIRITGATVFSAEELGALTAPYTGRDITSEELQALRDAITALYVSRGYVSSGAVIPDQDVEDGVVELRVVEGRLTELSILGNRSFHTDYLRDRLTPRGEGPLDIWELEERLQLLERDSRFRRVTAELGPGAARGEAALEVVVEEERALRAVFEVSNHESPDIGPWGGRVRLSHGSLTGRGDVLAGSYGLTNGLDDYDLSYELPLTSRDTKLLLRYRYTASEIVESVFDEFDIETHSTTYAIGASHPILQTLRNEVVLGLIGEWREARTFLLDDRAPFLAFGSDNGKTRASVLRFFQQWIHSRPGGIFALRSTFNLGLDVFGATVQKDSIPDGQFFSWIGQLQWLRRFPVADGWPLAGRLVELALRGDVQLSTDPLLSLEQFSLGGASSVRGYRENQVVRDMGYMTSLETRLRAWRSGDGRLELWIAPFVDVGRAWNHNALPGKQTLSSAGIGLRAIFGGRVSAQLYWGEELREVEEPPDRDLQDTGVHFRLNLEL